MSTHTHTFTWKQPAQSVVATGTFDDWKSTLPLTKDAEGHWSAQHELPIGKTLYKYVVDGTWLHNPDERLETDDSNNINNVVEHQAISTPAAASGIAAAVVAPAAVATAVVHSDKKSDKPLLEADKPAPAVVSAPTEPTPVISPIVPLTETPAPVVPTAVVDSADSTSSTKTRPTSSGSYAAAVIGGTAAVGVGAGAAAAVVSSKASSAATPAAAAAGDPSSFGSSTLAALGIQDTPPTATNTTVDALKQDSTTTPDITADDAVPSGESSSVASPLAVGAGAGVVGGGVVGAGVLAASTIGGPEGEKVAEVAPLKATSSKDDPLPAVPAEDDATAVGKAETSGGAGKEGGVVAEELKTLKDDKGFFAKLFCC